MNAGPEPQVDPQTIDQTRRQINRLRDDVARLSEMDMAPADYFGEFLMRVLTALAAPAGAVWLRTQHGNLQLQYQIQMAQVGLDRSEEARTSHDELLRQAVMQARPLFLPPHASAGNPQGQGPAPGNPTDYILLLVPIVMGDQVAGLVEVWQAPDRHPSAIQGFLQFLVHMSELASRFLRNRLLGDMISQQTLWTQLESFARTIHGSLSPVEVAYLIANEGRRLIDCDRVSIGVRTGRRTVVEAISGADVVEKRSNLVQRQRALFEKVIAWGEKLIYTGSKDDSLPPDVLTALDGYLEESNSKLLMVLPLRDEREGEPGKYKKPPRSALMMECFEPAAAPEQLVARTEVIGKHAAGALYNAVEHRRIPFRFIWAPLAKVQEGLGGKTNAIIFGILAALVVIAAVLYFVPYPLKMDATGQLLPETRRWVYSPVEAHTEEIPVRPNDQVGEGENLLRMYDVQLNLKIVQLAQEVASAQQQLAALEVQYNKAEAKDRPRINQELETQRATRDAKSRELKALMERTNSVEARAGEFWLKAPPFPPDVADGDRHWTILNADFRENLINRAVKPSDPLLRLGHTEGPWEIELKIPQKHIGQVLQAYVPLYEARKAKLLELVNKANQLGLVSEVERQDLTGKAEADAGTLKNPDLLSFLKRPGIVELAGPKELEDLLKEPLLDVDLLLKSEPTRTYKGKLSRDKIAGEANPNKDENNESEPVVLAWVRIDGDDIAPEDRIPQGAKQRVTGTEVHAKIRCGNHKMGYSLFYGVWEFFFEKVVFFF